MHECENLTERWPITEEKIYYCLKHHFFVDYKTYHDYCTKKYSCGSCRESGDKNTPSAKG